MSWNFTKENIFCISLDSRPLRRQKMIARFSAMGMEATICPASTPETLVDYFQSFCNPGQKACAQSHILVWKRILDTNLDYALVVEDDACFDKEWKKKLDSFVPPEGWDSICLNVSEPIVPRDTWVEAHDQYLTGGYIISRKGCEGLFNMFRNNYGSSDWMTTCLQRDNHCYTYFPWLIIQEGDESTIGSGVEADHAKVLRCLAEIDYSIDNYGIYV